MLLHSKKLELFLKNLKIYINTYKYREKPMAPNPLSKPILPKELQKLLSSAQNADQAFQKQSEDLLQRLLQFFLSLFFLV